MAQELTLHPLYNVPPIGENPLIKYIEQMWDDLAESESPSLAVQIHDRAYRGVRGVAHQLYAPSNGTSLRDVYVRAAERLIDDLFLDFIVDRLPLLQEDGTIAAREREPAKAKEETED